MKPLVIFEKVVKKYGKVMALNGLSFSLEETKYTALVGNNGCGKTTTVLVLCNLLQSQEGVVKYKGRVITPNYVSYKKELGIVLSEPYYIEEFTIEEYLKFVCKFQKVPTQDINKRINDLLALLNLREYKKEKIKNLSSGNQKKVSIAASLIHNPSFLIYDEPFLNLDMQTLHSIKSLLKSLKGTKTLLITSHNLDLIADLCDEFLIMEKGKVIAQLSKSEFPTIEDLKNYVANHLVKDKVMNNIEWLY